MQPISKTLVLGCLILSLAACTSYDFSRRVVQQGNLLPPAKVAALKIGMSKEAVLALLGSSLLSPLFDPDRWDYVYAKRRSGSLIAGQKLSLYFRQGRLLRIEKF